MPYYGYYGGYGDFLANNIYCILLIPVFALSLWAQYQVSHSFSRYSQHTNRRHLTGAQSVFRKNISAVGTAARHEKN